MKISSGFGPGLSTAILSAAILSAAISSTAVSSTAVSSTAVSSKRISSTNKYLDFKVRLASMHYFLVRLSKVTTPQDACRRLVLQVYLGSNTLEFSAIDTWVKCLLVGLGNEVHCHLATRPDVESLRVAESFVVS